MRVRVIPERVAAAGDFGDERGVTLGLFTDDEKRGGGAVGVEQVKDARRRRRIGAVVDGQPDLAPVGSKAADGGAEASRRGHEVLPDQPRRGAEKHGDCEGAVAGKEQDEGGDFCDEDMGDPQAKNERSTKTLWS
jgi:hypothetical protein